MWQREATESVPLPPSPSHHFLGPFFSPVAHASIVKIEMSDSLLINVCVVGGNAVSAFISWRLQATNACDVTLVWKSGFDAVYQYGISFKYVQGSTQLDSRLASLLTLPFADPRPLAMSGLSRDTVRSFWRILIHKDDHGY